jgi:hypothetical protein
MPSDRWDQAVLFHQHHMGLKHTHFVWNREHEYHLASRQICPRRRSKGNDWRAFRNCYHLAATLIGELEFPTVVRGDNSVYVYVRHCTVGTENRKGSALRLCRVLHLETPAATQRSSFRQFP